MSDPLRGFASGGQGLGWLATQRFKGEVADPVTAREGRFLLHCLKFHGCVLRFDSRHVGDERDPTGLEDPIPDPQA